MSAARLRQAAETLREQAKAASPGPWTAVQNFSSTSLRAQDSRQPKGWTAIGQLGHWRREGNAAYIATMHPGVGLALADWLDVIASKEEAREGIDSPIPVLYLPEALTIARAILGGAS